MAINNGIFGEWAGMVQAAVTTTYKLPFRTEEQRLTPQSVLQLSGFG